MNEAELIRRARQGDQAAWEALVQAHQEALFRLAYLFIGDPDSAQDAAQEAFIRAYQSLDRFDLERPFRPWLLTIAANQARNQLRSAGRYLAALKRKFQLSPKNETHIEESAFERWEARSLWQAVKRLPFEDQQVIYYRYFLELSVAETAAALGMPEGTVKSRLHRALGRLREVIARQFPGLDRSQKG